MQHMLFAYCLTVLTLYSSVADMHHYLALFSHSLSEHATFKPFKQSEPIIVAPASTVTGEAVSGFPLGVKLGNGKRGL